MPALLAAVVGAACAAAASWGLRRGRRGAPAGRPALVAAVTGALCAAVVAGGRADLSHAAPAVALVVVLVAAAASDLERRIVPNRLVAGAAPVAVALTAALAPGLLAERVLAGLGAGGALLLAALACPGGMGMGDVKLAAVRGLFLGAPVLAALGVALVGGTVAGAAIVVRHGLRAGRRATIPFVPFLTLGGVVALLAAGG